MKANVKKPVHFFLQTSIVNFGVVSHQSLSDKQELVICNTSHKQTRQFELRFESEGASNDVLDPSIIFEYEDDQEANKTEIFYANRLPGTEAAKRRKAGTVLLSMEAEEEIERTEQKLKIAERKGRPDKVRKLQDRLENLRSGKTVSSYDYEGGDVIAATHSPSRSTVALHSGSADRPIRKSNMVTVSVEPREMKKVSLYLSIALRKG